MSAIQRHLDINKKWAYKILLKFNKSKCKALCSGWSNSRHKHRLGDELMLPREIVDAPFLEVLRARLVGQPGLVCGSPAMVGRFDLDGL